MLKSLKIKNFKSFIESTFEFSPFTLLIGANASGKSNPIEAIQYLQWLIASPFDFADFIKLYDVRLPEREQLKNLEFMVEYKHTKHTSLYTIKCDENIENQENYTNSPYHKIGNIYSSITNMQDKEENHYELSSKIGDIVKNKEVIQQFIKKEGGYPLTIDIVISSDTNEEDISLNTQSFHNNFIDFLLRSFVLDTTPHLMRGYVNKNEKKLGKHGENLSAILYQLCQNPQNTERVLDCISCLPEQHITNIDFIMTERGDTMLKLTEKFGTSEQIIDAGFLSDGTLRVLAIIACILSRPRKSLLIIEEIDNGIHPSRIKDFLDKLKILAEERQIQVLMTSHNPALLDAIPKNAIENVVCCYRDKEKGDSRLVRLGDLYQYPELVALGSLGSLVTNGIVDKFVHDKRKEEEIQEEALNWLAEFRKEIEKI